MPAAGAAWRSLLPPVVNVNHRAGETDVFVVGGGPAGLAAAIAARRQGFQVVLADGSRPPIDKACGEGLLPDGRAALERLGLHINPAESYPFRGIRFLGSGVSVDASFPSGCGLGMRRTTLHRIMVEHAESVGVALRWGTPVTGIGPAGVLLGRETVRCRWIVGADGSNSRVRRWAALDSFHRNRQRFGFRRHYRIAPWTDCVEIYWGQGCQIYVTPIGPSEVCIVLITRDSRLRFQQARTEFPELAARLGDAQPTTIERGAVSASRRLKSVYRGRVVLVGDASGSVDAITGQGLCLSFQQAIALAGSLASGDLDRYQAEYRRIAGRPSLMADLLLSLENRSRIRGRVLRALASDPRIFARMLAMHAGAVSPLGIAANGVALGWRMLIA